MNSFININIIKKINFYLKVFDIEDLSSMMDPNTKRETLNKLKTIKEDQELKNRKHKQLIDKTEQSRNLKKIQSGNLDGMSREQISTSTKDAVLDLNMKTDMQQELLNNIGKNLSEANNNLNIVATEVDKQGNQIDRIQDNVGETQKVVGRTDKRITGMNRRVYCHKLLLNVLAVLLAVAVLITFLVKIVN